jgi:CheY-like chemotaxis protein
MTRILVVEDEPEIRENIQALLELEGYSVATASNGQEAIAELRNNAPRNNAPNDAQVSAQNNSKTDGAIDLILLDLSMPVMSGSEFLEEVAKNAGWSKIPVCITTGVAELPPFARPVDILRKPISFQDLMTHVRRALPKSERPPSSTSEEAA